MAQVTLSGRANLDVGTYAQTGAAGGSALDMASRTNVRDAASRIIFSSNEDLGGGLRAGVYCETGINIDNGAATGQSGQGNSGSSEWCSREGRVYFGNDTVEVRLGRQNIFWTAGAADVTASNLTGNSVSSTLYGQGVGVYSTRADNIIMLHGGKNLGAFAGSQLYWGIEKGGYGENSSSTTAGAAGGSSNVLGSHGYTPTITNTVVGGAGSGTFSGFKVTLQAAPTVQVMIDYQNGQNVSGAAGSTTTGAGTSNTFTSRSATKYQLAWKYAGGESIASVQYWNKERVDATSAFSISSLNNISTANVMNANANTGSGKDSGWVLNLNHDLGDGYVAVGQYGIMNNLQVATTAGGALTEVADSGATGFMVGGIKRLSKRTHLYAAYNNINNGTKSAIGFSGGVYQAGQAALGSNVTTTAIGLQHWF